MAAFERATIGATTGPGRVFLPGPPAYSPTICYPCGMSPSELAHLQLLAEVDSLVERLRQWADAAPAWLPGQTCRAVVGRLIQRSRTLRVRLEAPLIVATLGGTGTGKSSLVNALVGDEVVRPGRQRPTTTRPTLVCRPDLTPEMLGIDPRDVELVHRNLPALSDLVLLDCPRSGHDRAARRRQHQPCPIEKVVAALRRSAGDHDATEIPQCPGGR